MAQKVMMGENLEILNLAVTDSADTPVTFTQNINNMLIRCRTADLDLQFRTSSGATEYFTIPTGQSLTVELGSRTPIAGFVRSASGNADVEVLGMY